MEVPPPTTSLLLLLQGAVKAMCTRLEVVDRTSRDLADLHLSSPLPRLVGSSSLLLLFLGGSSLSLLPPLLPLHSPSSSFLSLLLPLPPPSFSSLLLPLLPPPPSSSSLLVLPLLHPSSSLHYAACFGRPAIAPRRQPRPEGRGQQDPARQGQGEE